MSDSLSKKTRPELDVRRGANEVQPRRSRRQWESLRHTLGNSISIFHENVARILWQITHPGGSFADYYADTIGRKLDQGGSHRTLGLKSWPKGKHFSESGDRKERFEEEGLVTFRMLTNLGIGPDARVIDYGCGSLRIGQHLMKYLAPGQYWGLDVTARFFTEGLKLLPRQLIAEKSPHLHVVDAQSLELARRAEADYVVSIAVMKHVPLNEIENYWHNLAGLMSPRATAIVNCDLSNDYQRTAGKSWAHGEKFVRELVGRHAPGRSVEIIYTSGEHIFMGKVFRKGTIVVRP